MEKSGSGMENKKSPLFMVARYVFVSRMFYGMNNVLEIGCGNCYGTEIVLNRVNNLTAIDLDEKLLEEIKVPNSDKFKFKVHDIINNPVFGKFDGAYSLDVLEHIPKKNEEKFISNIAKSLDKNGVLIVGVPSMESQKYRTKKKRKMQINCKNYLQLKNLLLGYFHNVFIFSMNGEIVHTEMDQMVFYYIAICCCRKV